LAWDANRYFLADTFFILARIQLLKEGKHLAWDANRCFWADTFFILARIQFLKEGKHLACDASHGVREDIHWFSERVYLNFENFGKLMRKCAIYGIIILWN
jgi:hypothetical protein